MPQIPIIIVKGTTVIIPITYRNPNGCLVDLTGYTARMKFRPTYESIGDPLLDLSTTDNTIVISGLQGLITIVISSSLTAGLAANQQMVYNLFITSGTGIVTNLLNGPSLVKGSTV